MSGDWNEPTPKEVWDGENRRDLSRKKSRKVKPYVIECRLNDSHTRRSVWWRGLFWKIKGRYAAETTAQTAFDVFKNSQGSGLKIQEYKSKSCDEEIRRFGVIQNDTLLREYRLVRRDN